MIARLTRPHLILAAAGGSAALLAGAFGFQALGYAPCQMCLWQRWPHVAAVLIGLAALTLPNRSLAGLILPSLGAAAAAISVGLGLFHTGVERGWWQGVTECAGGAGLSGLDAADLLDPTRQVGPPLVKCDEVAWEFLTLSMASWNALASAALALVWIAAALKARSSSSSSW